MKVSVIIPVFNQSRSLVACLESVRESAFQDKEVIVVDDASTEDVRAVVEPFGFTYLRLKRNGGPARARNAGATIASGDVLLFVDADVVLNTDTIDRVARAYQDKRVNVYQGIASKIPTNEGFGPALLALKWYFMLHGIREASFVYSHVFSIRNSTFWSVGGFNETFKPPNFGEEFELGTRLRESHAIHVDPELQVKHRFQGVMARARSVYHRAFGWARVFVKTRSFEKTNASFDETLNGIVGVLFLFSLFTVLFSLKFFLLSLLFLLIYVARVMPFLTFLAREKGGGFALKAIFPNLLWSIAACAGGAIFLLKYTFGIDYIARRGIFNLIKFRHNKLPSHLVLFVTAQCNAACAHCFYWKNINKTPTNELSLDEIEQISKNLASIEMLTITGGEPSLRHDLYEIIKRFYTNNGTRHVTLHTNGFNREALESIIRKCVHNLRDIEMNVSISFDGFPATHDRIRGVGGAFERGLRTLFSLIRLKHRYGNIHVTINACYTSKNAPELGKLASWFYRNFDIDNVYVALIRGSCKEPGLDEIDIDDYQRVVQHVNALKTGKRGYGNYALSSFRNIVDIMAPSDVIKTTKEGHMRYPCKAGRSVLVISERGDIAPCELLGKKLGSIRTDGMDIKSILHSGIARKVLKTIDSGACSCTWECAIMNNIIFTPRAIPRLIIGWLRYMARRGGGKGRE